MNIVSTAVASHYTCMKCGDIRVAQSNAPEISNASCSCGTEKVTLKKGKLSIVKAAPQNVVVQPPKQVTPPVQRPSPPQVFNPSATVGTVVQNNPLVPPLGTPITGEAEVKPPTS